MATAIIQSDYIISVEMKYGDTAAIFTCQDGDTYYAGRDGESWYLQFLPGEPTEGPFADIQAIRDWFNSED